MHDSEAVGIANFEKILLIKKNLKYSVLKLQYTIVHFDGFPKYRICQFK